VAFNADRPIYTLRATRAPQSGGILSGVLVIIENGKKTFSYVGFTPALISAVGEILPYGVSQFCPAYLQLTKWPTGPWVLQAKYVEGSVCRILREYQSLPVWVGKRKGSV